MGICYDLVSDSKMESFDLGKSFWGICWSDFQDSKVPCPRCNGTGVFPPTPGFGVPCGCNRTVIKEGFRPTSYKELLDYFESKLGAENLDDDCWRVICLDIWKFMESHSDWKVLNDESNDYSTFDTKEELEKDQLEYRNEDCSWPRYVEVGTRYLK